LKQQAMLEHAVKRNISIMLLLLLQKHHCEIQIHNIQGLQHGLTAPAMPHCTTTHCYSVVPCLSNLCQTTIQASFMPFCNASGHASTLKGRCQGAPRHMHGWPRQACVRRLQLYVDAQGATQRSPTILPGCKPSSTAKAAAVHKS
jgi:hypothetical protein